MHQAFVMLGFTDNLKEKPSFRHIDSTVGCFIKGIHRPSVVLVNVPKGRERKSAT